MFCKYLQLLTDPRVRLWNSFGFGLPRQTSRQKLGAANVDGVVSNVILGPRSRFHVRSLWPITKHYLLLHHGEDWRETWSWERVRETLSHPFLSPRLALGVAPLLLARQPRSRRGVAHLASIHCTRNRICPTTPTPPHHRRGNKVSNEQSGRTQPHCANLIPIGMYQTIRWFQSYNNILTLFMAAVKKFVTVAV